MLTVVANLVEEFENLKRIGLLFLVFGGDFDGNTLLEEDCEVVGLIGSIFRIDSLGPKLLGRSVIHVFKSTSFVTISCSQSVIATRRELEENGPEQTMKKSQDDLTCSEPSSNPSTKAMNRKRLAFGRRMCGRGCYEVNVQP